MAFVNYLRTLDEIPTKWEDCLILFRAHLIHKGLASRTITTYMTGVHSRLQLDGVDLSENQYLMKQMHRVARKRDVERVRCPISHNLLIQILKRVNLVVKTEFEAAMFKALFSLAFFGMFRIGELVDSPHALKACNVMQAEEGEHIVCVQHSSKTLKPGELPQLVDIPPDNTEFCPCLLTTHYTACRVWASAKWASTHEAFLLHQDGSRVSKAQVLRKIRACMRLIPGMTPMDFGTHSFRSGRATDLFKEGVPENKKMQQGHWVSATFKRYIKV